MVRIFPYLFPWHSGSGPMGWSQVTKQNYRLERTSLNRTNLSWKVCIWPRPRRKIFRHPMNRNKSINRFFRRLRRMLRIFRPHWSQSSWPSIFVRSKIQKCWLIYTCILYTFLFVYILGVRKSQMTITYVPTPCPPRNRQHRRLRARPKRKLLAFHRPEMLSQWRKMIWLLAWP